ncbi:bifunctional [glutamate--ammonia ligase]-adenylyl-L-tyrosine phosphorylase/[glutamate--ammonia-ligase] adenylyltransferase [Alloalcanivorax sp. C16-1]|uniref:bifunctional [glutamate--ammonia ligase]-adenylyl-L-tyrosine phosphorylase/[glutamate--ammonia-ligase] adenylyltransferase n=1 Tax=Alloalcanivorax sp. C16-1 TaxID=3390051 RepID=UPI003970A269
MTEPDYSSLPDELSVLVTRHWQRFQEVGHTLPDTLLSDLPRVWAGSDYVAEQFIRDPQLGEWLAASPLRHRLDGGALAGQVREAVMTCQDEDALKAALRRLRHRHMVRLIWRDLTGLADYHATVADLSLLADTLISTALERLYQWACERGGVPRDEDGEPVKLVVLAMGKLGARELNLSSDIDLIFAYEHEGEIAGERRALSHHQFFLRLGQQLIKALDQNTADGFVFRVDMRLRPWGKSGALAIGFDAMEHYYENQGREWERYALIKMRPVAGDLQAGARLIERLNPFVYRRYIDYGAFESLREMKALIEREVNRKGMQADVKLGAGGIREVEFIVQAFQLIRGGQLPALREPNLIKMLPRLADEGMLPEDVVEELREAYVFLRDVEHRLQAVADRQTQRLPDDELGWQRLTFAMDFSARAAFERALRRHREQVRYHFSQVIADPQEEAQVSEGDQELLDLWLGQLDHADAVARLESVGVQEAEEVLAALEGLRSARTVMNMQRIGRERLDRLMPLLLEALGYQGHGRVTAERLVAFVESVVRRSAYIALLVENPGALTQLVKLSGASPWIAERLARHPVLLDELLDVSTLYSPPGRDELDDELRQQLLRVAEDDLEQQMEVLRNFKQAHLLRVAASEVTEVLPLMKVSDYLTWLAEAILKQVVMLAWEPLVERHGRPGRTDGQPCNPDFVVVGYGKLGGIELGHNSDLDLVFLHDAASGGSTDGDRPVSNEQFYARLGQRIVHILSTRTMSGQLYEVDTRLRPSGSAGLLVSSMDAFRKYQLNDAWTWEHQALVRARVVAGCSRARERFDDIRHEVLCRPRERDALRRDVLAMREKMVDHLAARQSDRFHLKQDPGGIVDIEFMVQYGVLRWASSHGELTRFTDNVRLLETLAALELMPAQDAGLLREAYLAYRSAAHRASLRKEKSIVDDTEFRDLREGVRAIWDQWFADA